jgi:pre-mRNA-splicing factor SYF1
MLYERALIELPGSYKIWKAYLQLRASVVVEGSAESRTGIRTRKLPPSDPEWALVQDCFERALVFMHKFPVIWIMYLDFAAHLCRPTQIRRLFDQALKSLPITQNTRVWDLYLRFARYIGGPTGVRIFRRYLKLESDQLEAYVDMLVTCKPKPMYAEAATVLASMVENPNFKSKHGKSHYELWTELVDMICDHAADMDLAVADNTSFGGDDRIGIVERLDVDRILRAGISLFTDQVWFTYISYNLLGR